MSPLSSPRQVFLFIPVTFVLGCVFMIVVSFWAAPFECLVGSGIILTGVPAYLLGYKWKKPHVVQKMLGECEKLVFTESFVCLFGARSRAVAGIGSCGIRGKEKCYWCSNKTLC